LRREPLKRKIPALLLSFIAVKKRYFERQLLV
jgi:hypothetical protein